MGEQYGCGDWKFLYKRVSLATVANQPLVGLPEDVDRFPWGDGPFYPASVGYRFENVATGTMTLLETVGLAGGTQPIVWTPEYDETTDTWQLRVFPTPAAVYAIHLPYLRSPPDLIDLTDRPQIPRSLHATTAIGALAYAQEALEKVAQSDARERFMAAIAADWRMFSTPLPGQRIGQLRSGRRRGEAVPFDLEAPTIVQVNPP